MLPGDLRDASHRDPLVERTVAEFGRLEVLVSNAAYVFLASQADSSHITGTVLQVMGGETSGG